MLGHFTVDGTGFSRRTPIPSLGGDDYRRLESILRHVVLQGVTTQVTSTVAGLTNSCTVSQMLAVVTSHGHILAFDCTQALKWCIKDGIVQGAVSALRLLAGFARSGPIGQRWLVSKFYFLP